MRDDVSHEVSEPDVDAVIVGVRREELIAELLGLCDGFFRAAGPVVHEELRAFLISGGMGRQATLGWFLDVLGFAAAALEQPTGDRRSRGP